MSNKEERMSVGQHNVGTLLCWLVGHRFIYLDKTMAAYTKALPSDYCKRCGITKEELNNKP